MTLSTSAVAVCCSRELCQLERTCLDLLEQAGVLDCDHGLIGERPQQLRLALGEVPGRRTSDGDRPDRPAIVQHRDRKVAAEASCARHISEGVLRILQNVGDVGDRAVQDGAIGRAAGNWQARESAPHCCDTFKIGQPAHCHELDQLAVIAHHGAPQGVTEPLRARCN